ncbi:MAG: Hpt domain-containing protein [Pseudomonadota bacterium]
MPDHGEDIEPTLETEQLSALLEAAGPEGLNEIMDAFWRSTEELMSAVRQQSATGDFENAAKTAHALKGSASNIGAALLANLAKAMETACRTNDQGALDASISDANGAVDVTKSAIEALIATA